MAGIGAIDFADAGKWSSYICRGFLHGTSGGLFSTIQGASFTNGFASGFAASVAGDNFGSIGAKGNTAFHRFATSFAGRLVYGYVSGGIASEATGGNFLMGAATGAIVSLANHWLHGGFVKKEYYLAILHDKEAANGFGHTAAGIGKHGGKVTIYSKEGVEDANQDGKHDNKGIYGNSEIKIENYKNLGDLLIKNPQYEDTLIFDITKSEAINAMNNAFKSVTAGYILVGCSCVDVGRSALEAINITKYKPVNFLSASPNAQFNEYRRQYSNISLYLNFNRFFKNNPK